MPYEYIPEPQRSEEYPVNEKLAEMCKGLTTNVSIDNIKYFVPEEQELILDAIDEMEDVIEQSNGSHSSTYYRTVFLSDLFGYEDMEDDAQEAACRIALGIYRKHHPENDPKLANRTMTEQDAMLMSQGTQSSMFGQDKSYGKNPMNSCTGSSYKRYLLINGELAAESEGKTFPDCADEFNEALSTWTDPAGAPASVAMAMTEMPGVWYPACQNGADQKVFENADGDKGCIAIVDGSCAYKVADFAESVHGEYSLFLMNIYIESVRHAVGHGQNIRAREMDILNARTGNLFNISNERKDETKNIPRICSAIFEGAATQAGERDDDRLDDEIQIPVAKATLSIDIVDKNRAIWTAKLEIDPEGASGSSWTLSTYYNGEEPFAVANGKQWDAGNALDDLTETWHNDYGVNDGDDAWTEQVLKDLVRLTDEYFTLIALRGENPFDIDMEQTGDMDYRSADLYYEDSNGRQIHTLWKNEAYSVESALVLRATDLNGVDLRAEVIRHNKSNPMRWEFYIYNDTIGENIAEACSDSISWEQAFEEDSWYEELNESCAEYHDSMDIDDALAAVNDMSSFASMLQEDIDHLVGPVDLSSMLYSGYVKVFLDYTDEDGGSLSISAIDDKADSTLLVELPTVPESDIDTLTVPQEPENENKRLVVIGTGDGNICFTTEIIDGTLSFYAQTFGIGIEKKLYEVDVNDLVDDGMNEIPFSEASFEWDKIDGMDGAFPNWVEDEVDFYNVAENAYCHALREMLGFKDMVSWEIRSVCGYENMESIKQDEKYQAVFDMLANAYGIKLSEEQKEKFKNGEEFDVHTAFGAARLSPSKVMEELGGVKDEQSEQTDMDMVDGEETTDAAGCGKVGDPIEAYAHVKWVVDDMGGWMDGWNLVVTSKEYFDDEGYLDDGNSDDYYDIQDRLPDYCGELAESVYEISDDSFAEDTPLTDIQDKLSADCAANGLILIFGDQKFDALVS